MFPHIPLVLYYILNEDMKPCDKYAKVEEIRGGQIRFHRPVRIILRLFCDHSISNTYIDQKTEYPLYVLFPDKCVTLRFSLFLHVFSVHELSLQFDGQTMFCPLLTHHAHLHLTLMHTLHERNANQIK